MRFLILLALALTGCSAPAPASSPSEDTSLPLGPLVGDWDGTLTYTDYSDDVTQVTLSLSATVEVYRTKGIRLALTFLEPDGSAGGSSEITLLPIPSGLRYDGTDWTVLERRVDGDAFSVTIERLGEDNNRPAMIRRRLSVQDGVFSERKTIRYAGTETFFGRNSVRLTRRQSP